MYSAALVQQLLSADGDPSLLQSSLDLFQCQVCRQPSPSWSALHADAGGAVQRTDRLVAVERICSALP